MNDAWDQQLATAAWRDAPRPDGPQSWETLEVDGYARADALERRLSLMDGDLRALCFERDRLVDHLDVTVRKACVELVKREQSPVLRAIAEGIATWAWDMARAISGAPEMRVSGRARDQRFAFGSMSAALDFLETAEFELGRAPQSYVVAEDSDAARLARSRAYSAPIARYVNGQATALRTETMTSHPTRSSTGAAKGERAIELRASVRLAVQASGIIMIHPMAYAWLVWFHLGQWTRVTKKQRVGGDLDGAGRLQSARVRRTVTEIARDAGAPADLVRETLRKARRALVEALVERELAPRPKPRRRT